VQKSQTCAGNLDSPLFFLSSHAVGSMFEPPKLAACKRAKQFISEYKQKKVDIIYSVQGQKDQNIKLT
jgi:hypothetical protein